MLIALQKYSSVKKLAEKLNIERKRHLEKTEWNAHMYLTFFTLRKEISPEEKSDYKLTIFRNLPNQIRSKVGNFDVDRLRSQTEICLIRAV